MKTNTLTISSIRTGRILYQEFYFDFGRPLRLKGASSQETADSAAQAELTKTLTADLKEQFAGQGNVLKALQAAWEPILAKGPNQYGFAGAEDTALRTQAKEGTAAEYQQAKKALNENLAAAGGGNEFLPSGVNAQLNEGLAASAASDEATKELGITQAGYERGYQEYLAASNALTGNASIYNPVGFGNAADTAGANAFKSAYDIQQQSGGAWSAIGGLLGGAGSAFLGGLGANPGLFGAPPKSGG